MRIIKRYKNRRLYDTELKSYITHVELERLISGFEPFTVIDSVSGKDITLAVLGQVLIGGLKNNRHKTRSKESLIKLISEGGRKSMSILRNTYLASVGIYSLTRKKAEEVIDSLIKAGELSKSERKEAILELLDRAEKTTRKMKDKIIQEAGDVQKNLQADIGKVVENMKLATQKDIDALNKKIDELSRMYKKQ